MTASPADTAVHRPSRRMADVTEPVVVFLVGMRVNSLRRWRAWLPVSRAMGPMMRELFSDPSLGLLNARSEWSGRTITVVTYWRSFEHLERFANDKEDPHVAAWRNYWTRVGKDTRTGIWHETYLVRAGEYEAIYGNMPPHGLGKAGRLVPVSESSAARERLKAMQV